ncbi:unnamed protein product [Rhizoctonia solani]|nr:unnamed protein product [Rhizoctonia solani]
MPPNTVMQGGTLPLDLLFTFRSKSKPPPPEFTQVLLLDSTRLLSGLLVSHGNVEYAIATSGSKTVISRPAQSTNVAVIDWKQGQVETEGLRISRSEWVDESKWISARTHVFKKWGRNPEIKWEANNGEWKATNSKEVLAALVIRRGALGTRIEFTDAGRVHADALILTAIMTAIDKEEWKWHDLLQARRDLAGASNTPHLTGGAPDETTAPSPDDLPSYRQAPFTQPLGPLLVPTSTEINQEDEPSAPTDRPLVLILTSKHLLNGTWNEDGQPVVRVHTSGPQTMISRFVSTNQETEHTVKAVATINWAEGKVTVIGRGVELGSILGKNRSSMFTKASRKPQVCTLPTLTSHWTITPQTSSTSIYPDPNAHIRYECRSTPPDNRPLALLTHYLKRKGTVMELTPEGHGVLIEVIIGALVLACGATGAWKKVTGVGRNISGEGVEMVVGEEMVSDLDGWAGPVELMRLRQQGDGT